MLLLLYTNGGNAVKRLFSGRAEADIPYQVLYIHAVFDMFHQLLDNTGYILYYKDMTGKEIMKRLKQHGWVLDRIKGSHHIFIKGSKTIPVPVHGNKDIPIGTVKNIFRLAAIEEEI